VIAAPRPIAMLLRGRSRRPAVVGLVAALAATGDAVSERVLALTH
jgi:hypothetical protein